MEKPILLDFCSNSSLTKRAVLAPNPSSWKSVADICQDVAKCLKSNGPCGKRVIVDFFLPGTQIRIDIGNVKAAGVLCVLGISFSIGTYVLYKIYDRYFRPGTRRKPPADADTDGEEVVEDDLYVVKTDEGIMGNQQSSLADIPVYYKPGYGVSLYKPTDNPSIRNRKFGPHKGSAFGEPVITANLVQKNGIVLNYGGCEDTVTAAIPNRVPELSDLRIDVDEHGFVEDTIGANLDRLSNSLKGNFSPRSLYEKNRMFSEDLETDGGEHGVYLNDDINSPLITNNDTNTNTGNFNGAEHDHLKIDSQLGKSSVLLTPPSEDELSSASQPFHTGSEQISYHSTKSDVSEIHSEIADLVTETDEEREQMSPLPYDRSPHRTPEKRFQKKLILKLGEISTRGFGHSLGSNNSSSSSTPDSYLGIKRRNSLGERRNSVGTDKENSISGISSPELELLQNETTDGQTPPIVVTNTFSNLEQEIHGVEDEFDDINKKLQELSSKYSTETVEDPGSSILNDIFQRYPSIRVRQQERGVYHHRLSSLSDGDSAQVSASDEVELSWDLENVLDMVYSEASENNSMHNNPVDNMVPVQQCVQQTVSSVNQSNQSINNSQSFTSTVEIDGNEYEDEFHLQLGTAALSKISENEKETMVITPSTPDTPDTGIEVTPPTTHSNSSSRTPPTSGSDNKVAPPTNDRVPPTNGSDLDVIQSTTNTIYNVREKEGLAEYADKEWKGDTPKAELMRLAYKDIPQHCPCCHLRRIRGDNYCGVRGAIYQTLINVVPLTRSSKDKSLRQLSDAFNTGVSGLSYWTFANRITHNAADALETMERCISTLFTKYDELQEHSEYSDREVIIERLLNSDPSCDLELMEGVKLLMLLSAIELYKDIQLENDVPIFAWLMFARDTSTDIESFVRNHLNPVGDSSGLEQVEMFLLGYSLGVRIQVFRLQQYGQDDFISYYPSDCDPAWPTISLIAEDDRHYNVPVL